MRAPASLVAIPLLVGVAAGLRFFETQHLPLCAAAGAVLALVAGIAAFADGGNTGNQRQQGAASGTEREMRRFEESKARGHADEQGNGQ